MVFWRSAAPGGGAIGTGKVDATKKAGKAWSPASICKMGYALGSAGLAAAAVPMGVTNPMMVPSTLST